MLHDYNVDARADDFINYVLKAANAYRTNNVAITTGMDFHYQVIIYFGLGLSFLLDYDFCTLFRYFCKNSCIFVAQGAMGSVSCPFCLDFVTIDKFISIKIGKCSINN